LYIPQSKIKDFCQPPLGKGAFDANLKQRDKLGFGDSFDNRIIQKIPEKGNCMFSAFSGNNPHCPGEKTKFLVFLKNFLEKPLSICRKRAIF